MLKLVRGLVGGSSMRSDLDAVRKLFSIGRATLRSSIEPWGSRRRCAFPGIRRFGALLLMVALTTWLPPACAATPEELSRQYSDDWVRALDEVLVPQAFLGVARTRQIVRRLARMLGDGDWKVLVFPMADMPRDRQVPAFALPGKYIAVSDWAARKDSDDELAFMIGHEMGHVHLHHMDAMWQATMACAHVDPETWTALAAHADCATPIMRQQELEADAFGYALAAKAGFDARKGARQALEGLEDDAMHPPSAVRLKQLGIKADDVQKQADRVEIQSRRACHCSRLE